MKFISALSLVLVGASAAHAKGAVPEQCTRLHSTSLSSSFVVEKIRKRWGRQKQQQQQQQRQQQRCQEFQGTYGTRCEVSQVTRRWRKKKENLEILIFCYDQSAFFGTQQHAFCRSN
eukprot:scaffold76485_cov55-Attheya_sp.AAC.1